MTVTREEVVQFYEGKIQQLLNKWQPQNALKNLLGWVNKDRFIGDRDGQIRDYVDGLKQQDFVSIVLEAARNVCRETLLIRAAFLKDHANWHQKSIHKVLSDERRGISTLSLMNHGRTENIHDSVAQVILIVATVLNQRQFDPIESRLALIQMAKDKERARRFLDALFEYILTLKSITTSIRLFRSMIFKLKDLVTDGMLADGEIDSFEKQDLLFWQSFLIYEMAGVVFKYLDHIEIKGLEQIRDIRIEVEREIQDGQRRDLQLREDTRSSAADQDAKNKTYRDIDVRSTARGHTLDQWSRVAGDLEEKSRLAREFVGRLETVKVMGDNALAQIDCLDTVIITKPVEETVGPLGSLLRDAEKIEFDMIDPDAFLRLLNIGTDRGLDLP